MQAAGRLTRASKDLCGRANGFPGSAVVLRLGCLSEKKVMTASSCGYSFSAGSCDPASQTQTALARPCPTGLAETAACRLLRSSSIRCEKAPSPPPSYSCKRHQWQRPQRLVHAESGHDQPGWTRSQLTRWRGGGALKPGASSLTHFQLGVTSCDDAHVARWARGSVGKAWMPIGQRTALLPPAVKPRSPAAVPPARAGLALRPSDTSCWLQFHLRIISPAWLPCNRKHVPPQRVCCTMT